MQTDISLNRSTTKDAQLTGKGARMKNLHVQIQINEPDVLPAIRKFLDSMPGLEISTLESSSGSAEPGIIIVDDFAKNGAIFEVLADQSAKFPDAAIFVVSAESSAEHIVKTIKAGASEYFPLPLDFDKLRQSIEESRTATANVAKGTRARVHSFISSKGGLGTTMLAVNVAAAMAANQPGRVALCDLSLQAGDATVFLDLTPETTIGDLYANFHRLDDSLLKNALTRHGSGLELLPAPRNPGEMKEVHPERVERIINDLAGLYGQVVIDCPSMSLSETTLRVLKESDKIFIVLDLSVPAIRNASRLARELGKNGLSQEQLEFVINRYTKNSAISVKEADKSLDRSVYWIFPNCFEEVFSSITSGMPLVIEQPRSELAKNIRKFLEKIDNPDQRQEFRGVSNLFGRAV
jgi:pilus assembly protein CpaE